MSEGLPLSGFHVDIPTHKLLCKGAVKVNSRQSMMSISGMAVT